MITDAQREHTNTWLGQFRGFYLDDTPVRLHSRDLDGDGKPMWSAGMRRRMQATDRRERVEDGPEESSIRIRRAMKRLRNRSWWEYIVLYRVMVLGESLDSVTDWLNSEPRPFPQVTPAKTQVIVYAAVDKVYAWF